MLGGKPQGDSVTLGHALIVRSSTGPVAK
jgi:hypothetical protein